MTKQQEKQVKEETVLQTPELNEELRAEREKLKNSRPDRQQSKKYSAEELKQLEEEAETGKNENIDLNEIKLSKSALPKEKSKENAAALNKENTSLPETSGSIALEDLMSRRAMPDIQLPFTKLNQSNTEIQPNPVNQKNSASQNLLSPQYYYQALRNMLSSQENIQNEVISTVRNKEKIFASDSHSISRPPSTQTDTKNISETVTGKPLPALHAKTAYEASFIRQQTTGKDYIPVEFKNSASVKNNIIQTQTNEILHAAHLARQNNLNRPAASPAHRMKQKMSSLVSAISEPVKRIAAKIRLSSAKSDQPVNNLENKNKQNRTDIKPSAITNEPVTSRITKDLTELIKKNVPSAARIPADQILTVVKSIPEVKAFEQKFESLSKENSAKLIQQMQSPMAEIFRMVSAKQSVQLTANIQHNIPSLTANNPTGEIKAVVAETISRIGTLYGTTFPATTGTKENLAENKNSAASEKNIKSENAKNQKPHTEKPPPPVFPPQPPPAAGAFLQGNIPSQAMPLNTDRTDKISKAGLDKDSEKPERERAESEERLENNQLSELEELLRNEKSRRLKEEKILKILKVHTISGRVLNEKSGKGIPGVFVNAGELGTAVTDRGGEFSFYNVPNGKIYSINVIKNGYKFTPSSITDTADAPNRHFFYGYQQG